jgi:hypothetical protein
LRPVIMLFAGVALACVMMSAISARRGKDD